MNAICGQDAAHQNPRNAPGAQYLLCLISASCMYLKLKSVPRFSGSAERWRFRLAASRKTQKEAAMESAP